MLRRISCTLAFVLFCASLAAACNIPVFRYALERWHPDKTEIIAFVDDQTAGADQAFLQSLNDASSKSDSAANVELLRVKPDQPGDHAELLSLIHI